MKAVFCDTSGLYAIMDPGDRFHRLASGAWLSLRSQHFRLVTTNYAFVETAALVQRRHGLEKLQSFIDITRRCIDVHFIDAALHDLALDELLKSGRRSLSLVDCASFAFMRYGRIEAYFGFDKDFAERGFTSVTNQ
jgi:predicted nucleic acid-binding protein